MTNYFDINCDFTCVHCHNYVSAGQMLAGVHNRNHCPYCLWSRHLDQFKAGDRMAACKAAMQPIGLTMKYSQKKYTPDSGGELMLVHLCGGCEKISINRIAADDIASVILETFTHSLAISAQIKENIHLRGIKLLEEANTDLVYVQLYGQSVQPAYSDLISC